VTRQHLVEGLFAVTLVFAEAFEKVTSVKVV